MKAQFIATLEKARADLTGEQEQDLVMQIWYADLAAHLDGYVTTHRRMVVAALENWWDKYAVSLADLETQRDAATSQLTTYLKGLGYA